LFEQAKAAPPVAALQGIRANCLARRGRAAKRNSIRPEEPGLQMDARTFESLQLGDILEAGVGLCQSPLGRERVREARPASTLEEVTRHCVRSRKPSR
jgi:hypothetical protein